MASEAAHAVVATPAPPPSLTNSAKNKQNHRQEWPYGNYRSYYSFRSGTTQPDAPPADQLDGRLSLLDPALFREKTLLDIGTNSGKIALDALLLLGARAVAGVDIDPLLIEDARKAALERGLAHDDPRVEFRQANVMEEGWFERFEPSVGKVDVVTLFSITKWLHLHNGDEGMRRLFRSLHTFLPTDGVVIVEPQEWDNYKRAVKRNKDLRETFKTLELRPPFDAEMREVGFVLEEQIEREEGGFSRPLLVWRKVKRAV
ncbi:hypothetical protein Rhopal_000738-T1 [Rhodotorula paludigena]|uniref:RNA methyltransferase n=1 Tax=Rhodotorula paludigena TaxID=86838 RepID=A0AAV5GBW2_9BASI|nr:hypothetical protein Rhopal_000738-T1 [Rhodotorula paludigena]